MPIADLHARCTFWHGLVLREIAAPSSRPRTLSPAEAHARSTAARELVWWRCIGPDLRLTPLGADLLAALEADR